MAGGIDLNLNFINLFILSSSSLDMLFSRSPFSPYKTISPSPSSSSSEYALVVFAYTRIHQHSSRLIQVSDQVNMRPTHRLLLVALLFFCIVSSTVSARSLRETSSGHDVDENSSFNQKAQSQGGEQLNGGDLETMDYTPAKKNPPIHN